MDATILYYTSNREKPEFEQKIRENLLKVCGDLPIISVSQKPIDLGKNICVGDVGISGFNMFRQILIACEAAATKFVISAEADCLYPPDYFAFIPPKDDICYRNNNIYVMAHNRDFFRRKYEGSTFAQIIGREYYIKILKELFKDAPEWSEEEKSFPKERFGRRRADVFDKIDFFTTENPCLSFKSGRGMRNYSHSDRTPVHELPCWGSCKELINKYL